MSADVIVQAIAGLAAMALCAMLLRLRSQVKRDIVNASINGDEIQWARESERIHADVARLLANAVASSERSAVERAEAESEIELINRG